MKEPHGPPGDGDYHRAWKTHLTTWLCDPAGAQCRAEILTGLRFQALCSRLSWKAQLSQAPAGLGSNCSVQSAWMGRRIPFLTLMLPQDRRSWAGATNQSLLQPSHMNSPPEHFYHFHTHRLPFPSPDDHSLAGASTCSSSVLETSPWMLMLPLAGEASVCSGLTSIGLSLCSQTYLPLSELFPVSSHQNSALDGAFCQGQCSWRHFFQLHPSKSLATFGSIFDLESALSK